MNQTKSLVEAVVRGLKEKKGRKIVKVDLSLLTGAICEYMIICEGNSPTQLSALTDSVWDIVRRDAGEKPQSIDGGRNSPWIGMDYGTVIVHIFMPEQRAFYNVENLWADSKITEVLDNE
ncbi:MAG: ribosome silencing factor [Tannerella sp.]|jgi:ribosome-associated protein|nr:ribosome silencing factor [Tannerella sp.]